MSIPWGSLEECRAIEDDLACLAAGALPANERAHVLAHAGSCPRCAGELAGLTATADALRRLKTEDLPLDFELIAGSWVWRAPAGL